MRKTTPPSQGSREERGAVVESLRWTGGVVVSPPRSLVSPEAKAIPGALSPEFQAGSEHSPSRHSAGGVMAGGCFSQGRTFYHICLSVCNTPAKPQTTLKGSAHTHSGPQSAGKNGEGRSRGTGQRAQEGWSPGPGAAALIEVWGRGAQCLAALKLPLPGGLSPPELVRAQPGDSKAILYQSLSLCLLQ